MQFLALNDDERVITETAAAFASKRLAPYALEWDATNHFPTDVLREAAELGMAAIYCRDDVGAAGCVDLTGSGFSSSWPSPTRRPLHFCPFTTCARG